MFENPQLGGPHFVQAIQSLKNTVAAIFSLAPQEITECERRKDAPTDLLLGHSYSDWQNAVAEKLIKKMAGDSAFEYLARRRIVYRPEALSPVSDMGCNADVSTCLPTSSQPQGSKIFVFFNGPPGAGKDEGSGLLSQMLGGDLHLFKMSQPLKDAVAAIFSLTPEEIVECERQKNDPIDLLLGHSYRNWQIAVSETLVKKWPEIAPLGIWPSGVWRVGRRESLLVRIRGLTPKFLRCYLLREERMDLLM